MRGHVLDSGSAPMVRVGDAGGGHAGSGSAPGGGDSKCDWTHDPYGVGISG